MIFKLILFVGCLLTAQAKSSYDIYRDPEDHPCSVEKDCNKTELTELYTNKEYTCADLIGKATSGGSIMASAETKACIATEFCG